MNDWTAGIGEAVSYIENNLDGEINIEKAAFSCRRGTVARKRKGY